MYSDVFVLLQISRSSKTQLKQRDDVLSAEAQMSNAPKTKGACWQ